MKKGREIGDIKRIDRRGSGQHAILRALIDHEGLSKKDIANYLGLSASFVTQAANTMIEEGSIKKTGEIVSDEHQPGRKKELICLNPDYRYVFAINLEAENTYIALCNLRAQALYHCSIKNPHDSSDNPDEFVIAIAEKCMAILQEQKLPINKVLGCGITILGRVDNVNNIALDTYGVWKKKVKLDELFSKYLPFPIIAENNANALAIADLLFGQSRTCKNVVYIKWIPGVGGAIVENGQLMVGNQFGAGEFGHLYAGAGDEPCRCGKSGCLETVVSVFALSKLVKTAVLEGKAPKLSKKINGDISKITEETFHEWIITGDQWLDSQIQERIALYAVHISNIVNTLSPEKVIFFGKGFLECPQYFSLIRETILRQCPFLKAEDLALTNFREEYHFIGGAAVAINRLLLKDCNV